MAISKVIQERRKALGLTQEQVAEYLGVTTPAVNKWEKGSTCPDIALLAPLARLLKTDLNQYNTLVGHFQMAVANKDVTKTIEILRKMLNTMTHTWTVQVSPLYRRIETNNSGASMEKMIAPLLQGLRQSPDYAYLQNNEEFLVLLSEFENKVK